MAKRPAPRPAARAAKALAGPSGARTPASSRKVAAAHAASVARMAVSARVKRETTGAMVKTRGLKLAAPQVKLDTPPRQARPLARGVATVASPVKRAKGARGKPTEVSIQAARAKSMQELEAEFEAFFRAEIDAELEREAEIFHDRVARWRCQCCDALLVVPRRTTVLHGDYILVHDDLLGLLVNGERFVPKATDATELKQPGRIKVEKAPIEVYTPEVEVIQPGRLKDPYRNLR
ncbi:MAG: hypothetical protein ACYDBQ_00920 [Thermoplasmatota archaeon]